MPVPFVMATDMMHIDADCMGIVFSSYLAALAGLPLIVERFIRKIDNIGSLHIFAVCTCGGRCRPEGVKYHHPEVITALKGGSYDT